MAATLPELFSYGTTDALRLLRTIYSDRLTQLQAMIGMSTAEIRSFNNPKYWKRCLEEAEELGLFRDHTDPERASVSGTDVIDRLAQQGMILDFVKDNALQQHDEMVTEMIRVVQLLSLIEKRSSQGIIDLLEEEAAGLRSRAVPLEEVAEKGKGTALSGMSVKADRMRTLADFYDICIRMIRSKMS